MADSRQKLEAYVLPLGSYWRGTEALAFPARDHGVERYPLDIAQRLDEGHYDRFDADGVPVRPSRDGRGVVYNVTTVSSWALANWDRYLVSGDDVALAAFLSAARFLRGRVGPAPFGGEVFLDAPGARPSAMNQGEAMSVMVRAWKHTGDERYLEAARGAVPAFRASVEAGGVTGKVSSTGCLWYEEGTSLPLRHILNGMVYALWGLRDVALVAEDEGASELFDAGIDSLERSLHLFDTGRWSWYWWPEDGLRYVASMMYHNLHVVQLEALARVTGRQAFAEAARCFRGYAASPGHRLRAGVDLFTGKLAMRRGRAR